MVPNNFMNDKTNADAQKSSDIEDKVAPEPKCQEKNED